jgi:hypothetical protein
VGLFIDLGRAFDGVWVKSASHALDRLRKLIRAAETMSLAMRQNITRASFLLTNEEIYGII